MYVTHGLFTKSPPPVHMLSYLAPHLAWGTYGLLPNPPPPHLAWETHGILPNPT